MRIDVEVVLVAGEAGGIGSIGVRRLGAAGATVIIADIELGAMSEAAVGAKLSAASIAYQMISSSGTVHAFTIATRDALRIAGATYDATAYRRSRQAIITVFEEYSYSDDNPNRDNDLSNRQCTRGAERRGSGCTRQERIFQNYIRNGNSFAINYTTDSTTLGILLKSSAYM